MKVELIYSGDCPNVAQARKQLLRAFAEADIPANWVEWESGDDDSPPYARAYGSPTILIDGKDIAGTEPSVNKSCCRLYPGTNGGSSGAPSVEMISLALRSSVAKSDENHGKGWRTNIALVLGIVTALLPKGICPACWPAYAGVLSSLGIGFLLKTKYLFPLTAVFLFIAVAVLAYKAKRRKGYGPFFLGFAGAAMVLIGKFIYVFPSAMYTGITLLVAASIWNAWPENKTGDQGACPACRQTL